MEKVKKERATIKLNEKEIILSIIELDPNMNQHRLSKELGLQTQAGLYSRLNRNKGTMGLGTFYQILEKLGYEVIIRPKIRDSKTTYKLKEDGAE